MQITGRRRIAGIVTGVVFVLVALNALPVGCSSPRRPMIEWISVSAILEEDMVSGWAKDGAVQEQIDASVEDAVARARSRLPSGESRLHCCECEEPIPEGRRKAIPGVQLCVACQEELDAEHREQSLYNRRGSKDSQLK